MMILVISNREMIYDNPKIIVRDVKCCVGSKKKQKKSVEASSNLNSVWSKSEHKQATKLSHTCMRCDFMMMPDVLEHRVIDIEIQGPRKWNSKIVMKERIREFIRWWVDVFQMFCLTISLKQIFYQNYDDREDSVMEQICWFLLKLNRDKTIMLAIKQEGTIYKSWKLLIIELCATLTEKISLALYFLGLISRFRLQ